MAKRQAVTVTDLNTPALFTPAKGVAIPRSPLTASELGEFAPPAPSTMQWGEDWHAEARDAMSAGYPARVVGRAGAGKDYYIEQECAYTAQPLLSLSVKPELDINEWVASTHLVVEGGATVSKVELGPLARAVQGVKYTRNGREYIAPVTILISDIDRAHPRQVEVLRQALQSQGSAYLTNPVTGEKIPVLAGTRFYLTANAGADGDGGRGNVSQQLDTSIINRTIGVLASEPTPEYERKIIASRFPALDKAQVALVVKLSRAVKEAIERACLPLEVSIRTSIQLADIASLHTARGVDFNAALRKSVSVLKGHLMVPENRGVIDGAVEAVLGGAVASAPAQSPIDY